MIHELAVERVRKQAAMEGQSKFVCERGSLLGSLREDVGFTINSAEKFQRNAPR